MLDSVFSLRALCVLCGSSVPIAARRDRKGPNAMSRHCWPVLLLVAATLAPTTAVAQRPPTLTVEAGRFDRAATPIRVELPAADLPAAPGWAVRLRDEGQELRFAQVDKLEGTD